MLIRYDAENNELYNQHGNPANPTLIRQEMAKLLRLSYDHPLMVMNGEVTNGHNLVDLVAEYYGLDRHELGNLIGKLQLTALLNDPAVAAELNGHGLALPGVGQ